VQTRRVDDFKCVVYMNNAYTWKIGSGTLKLFRAVKKTSRITPTLHNFFPPTATYQLLKALSEACDLIKNTIFQTISNQRGTLLDRKNALTFQVRQRLRQPATPDDGERHARQQARGSSADAPNGPEDARDSRGDVVCARLSADDATVEASVIGTL